MALPVSIGDAILLSKLAYRLGHSITIGRKHAPAGLQEVQNQLYSLGNALNSVAHCVRPEGSAKPGLTGDVERKGDQDKTLAKMIQNCRSTLERMEVVIKKYDGIQEKPDDDQTGDAEKKKWKDDIKTNWRKIRWTAATEELDGIRKNLGTHIDSLTLFVAGLNHSQTRTIGGKVDGIHTMLLDVHSWFNENLKGHRTTSDSATASANMMDASDQNLKFELSADLLTGQKPILLCPQARFQKDWIDALVGTARANAGVFRCCCPRTNQNSEDAPHASQVRFSLLSISLLVKLAGATDSWQIYCTANKVTRLMISGIAIEDLTSFQNEVDKLAAVQSHRSLTRNANSTLIYHSRSDVGMTSSVLDMKSDMSQFEGLVFSIAFRCEGTVFTQRSVDTIQMLHYRTLEDVSPQNSAESWRRNLLHERFAELVIHIVSMSAGSTRLIARLNRTTACEYDERQSTVKLYDAMCQSEDASGSRDDIRCEEVGIECVSPAVASRLYAMIKSVTQELQIQYLKFARVGESVVTERACGDMMIDHLYLAEPQAVVVFDPESSLHRLILRSGPLSSVVTMELPETCLRTILLNGPRGMESKLEAHFVEPDRNGTKIRRGNTRFPQELLEAPTEGMRALSFS